MYEVPTQLWPPTFDAAIFDFDGTIADTAWLWQEVDRTFLSARNIPYTREYARRLAVLGFAAGAEYTIATYGLRERPEDICEEWTRLSHALYSTRVQLRQGVRAYITALRARGIRTALATANEPELILSMRRIDVNALFDVCVYGREVNAPKDQPDIYLEAARRLDVPPHRCIVFEDIVPGILAARDAGFLTCALHSGDPSQQLDDAIDAAHLYLREWVDIPLA